MWRMTAFAVLILLSLPGCSTPGNGSKDSEQENKSEQIHPIPGPTDESPLRLKIEPLEEQEFHLGDPIRFKVSVKNVSSEPILVCRVQWTRPRGILKFDVYDDRGQEVDLRRTSVPRIALDPEKDIVVLDPDSSMDGILDLTEYNTVYEFGRGKYSVAVHYFCPYEGTREIGDRSLRIADRLQRSMPVQILTDYAPG